MDSNRLSEAQQRIDRMRTLYPGNYPLNQARVDLLLKQNNPKEADKALEALLKSRPDDPDVWYSVAETRGLSGNIIGLHQARAEYFALVGELPPGHPAAGFRPEADQQLSAVGTPGCSQAGVDGSGTGAQGNDELSLTGSVPVGAGLLIRHSPPASTALPG
jgi:Putative Zn-dependent protease, contains TPR repeats